VAVMKVMKDQRGLFLLVQSALKVSVKKEAPLLPLMLAWGLG
jgi:hypothetical protein